MPQCPKTGDLVRPVAIMRIMSGFREGTRAFWAGAPGLVVKVEDNFVDVLSCDELHRNIKMSLIELYDESTNN